MNPKDCCVAPVCVQAKCSPAPAVVSGTSDGLLLCLPGFCFTEHLWIRASYIVYEFWLKTSFLQLTTIELDRFKTDDYILAVRTQGSRYIFWESEYMVMIHGYELYNSQPIGPDAVFEIWRTSATDSVVEESLCMPILDSIEGCDDSSDILEVVSNKRLFARFVTNPVGINPPPPFTEVFKVRFAFEKPC